MIILNFGKSEFVRYGLSETKDEPDMVIKIPVNEKLDRDLLIKEDDLDSKNPRAYLSILNPFISKQVFSAVGFQLKADYEKNYDVENKVIVPWVEQRGEWAAITYRRWMEGSYRYDECYEGPFKPNEFCLLKILEAYNISAEEIKLEDIIKTSPEGLIKREVK